MSILYAIIGILFLYFGGEFLVRCSSYLARAWGISSMVIGLTVVAMGTSSPELCASLFAALAGIPAVAIGNVVGSNIANIGFILGLSCMIFPLQSTKPFIKREVPLMIGSGALLIPFCWMGGFGRLPGLLFLAILAGYMWVLVRETKAQANGKNQSSDDVPSVTLFQILKALAGVVLGIALLVVGANYLIEGAVTIAESFGIPDRIIGLTLVAVGTSLPELAASIVAAIRRESDIVLGNLIGSNIFNALGVLGATVVICPIPVNWIEVRTDLLVMLGITFLVLPFIATNLRLGRIEGMILLLLYFTYVGFLFA